MKPCKGYYSLIQYCPDLGRLEAANVGVLLFCPEMGFLKSRTVRSNARIRKFFGSEGHDWRRIDTFKKGLVDRLEHEAAGIQSLENLEQFIALRANLLQITPPRPMKVTDPDKELEELFREITGEPTRRTPTRSLRKHIDQRITAAGLDDKVRRDVAVTVEVLQEEVTIPFGFQNGCFNLINPVPFEAADPRHSVSKACDYAVEGQSLQKHRHPQYGDLQLIVVGKFKANDRDTPSRVGRVFEESGVKLYRNSQLRDLIDEIRRTGKDLPVG